MGKEENKLANEKKTEESKSSSSVLKHIDTNKKQTEVRKAHERKARIVGKLAERIKNAKTFMIVSIKNLPSPQFQKIKKNLREHAKIKVAKKNILRRAIEELKKESILPLENEVQENCAFVISDLEGFELASLLAKNKTPIYAKAGQEAIEDIEVKAGPTGLTPGPAISELGALGIQIAVEDGKISIKQPKVIVKKGEVIDENAASILQKLDIKPFDIGLEPIALYDVQSEKIYKNIKIDSEEAIENLKQAKVKALGLAQKIVYYCKDTIGYLLAKANLGAGALEKLAPKEEKEEIRKEEKATEEVKEETTKSQTTDNSSEKSETDNKENESDEKTETKDKSGEEK